MGPCVDEVVPLTVGLEPNWAGHHGLISIADTRSRFTLAINIGSRSHEGSGTGMPGSPMRWSLRRLLSPGDLTATRRTSAGGD
jgi:hypothetical protein